MQRKSEGQDEKKLKGNNRGKNQVEKGNGGSEEG